jgi:hypothetical protein
MIPEYAIMQRTEQAPLEQRNGGFENVEASIQTTSMILIRTTVAKILKLSRWEMILKAIPVVKNDSTWNCITWVKNALEELHKSGCLGTHQTE